MTIYLSENTQYAFGWLPKPILYDEVTSWKGIGVDGVITSINREGRSITWTNKLGVSTEAQYYQRPLYTDMIILHSLQVGGIDLGPSFLHIKQDQAKQLKKGNKVCIIGSRNGTIVSLHDPNKIEIEDSFGTIHLASVIYWQSREEEIGDSGRIYPTGTRAYINLIHNYLASARNCSTQCCESATPNLVELAASFAKLNEEKIQFTIGLDRSPITKKARIVLLFENLLELEELTGELNARDEKILSNQLGRSVEDINTILEALKGVELELE